MNEKINKELNSIDRRNIRLRTFDFSQKVDQAAKNTSTIETIIKDLKRAETKYMDNESKVKTNLDSQKQKIEEKLQERKKNSFIKSQISLHTSHNRTNTLQTSSSHIKYPLTVKRDQDGNESISYANVLGELDDQECERSLG